MRIVNEDVLDVFRGPGVCELCRKAVKSRQPHHVHTRGAGRVDAAWNIVALCVPFSGGNDCHYTAHTGKPTRQDLLAIAAKREGTTVQAILDALAAIRLMDKDGKMPRDMRLSREARRLVKQAMEGVQT